MDDWYLQSWIMHACRLVRDNERLPQHSEALITWTAITLMTRRLTQPTVRLSKPPLPFAETTPFGRVWLKLDLLESGA